MQLPNPHPRSTEAPPNRQAWKRAFRISAQVMPMCNQRCSELGAMGVKAEAVTQPLLQKFCSKPTHRKWRSFYREAGTNFPTASLVFPAGPPRGAQTLPLPCWESYLFHSSVYTLLSSLEIALLSTCSQLPSIPFLFWKPLPLHLSVRSHPSVLTAWWHRTVTLSSNLGWAHFLLCKIRVMTA